MLVLVLMSVCVMCAQTLLFSDSVVTMLLLLMAGDVETNPGPAGRDCMHICFMYSKANNYIPWFLSTCYCNRCFLVYATMQLFVIDQLT